MRFSFCFAGFLFRPRVILGFLLAAGLFFAACKSEPPPREEPSASIVFTDIAAEDPDHLILTFNLEIKNPVSSSGRVKIKSWQTEINGQIMRSGLDLDFPGSVDVSPGSVSIPLVLKMDMTALAAEGLAPADDCRVNLAADLDFTFDSAEPAAAQASGIADFPRVRAPVFSINAIAILKAELINTRFRVTMKIDNPNPFPVELSAFGYELYGNRRLWAEGTEKNIIRVPGKTSVEGNLFLIMNFIGMKRDLLDQIIRLEDVNYRFAGEARVGTGVEYLPEFPTKFDLSGYSRVLEN